MRAAVESIPPDPDEASRRLDQAKEHLASARAEGVAPASAYLMLYTAAHGAATAVLLAEGRRVSAGEAGHAILFRALGTLLGKERTALVQRVDRARQHRNRVAYEAVDVTAAQLESLRNAAAEMISVVEERLSR
jgi:hypothetical protein